MTSLALIGYGYWGQTLCRYLRSSPDFKLKYIHFRSLASLSRERIAQDYGSEFEPSLQKILDDDALDAVIIATPIASHYELVKTVLAAGKHVLCEKPLTLDPEQARELRRIARESCLALETDYTYTFSPALNHAREILAQGELGRVRHVRIRWLQYGRFNGYDVGALIGSHALSVLDLFLPLSGLTHVLTPEAYHDGLLSGARVHLQDARGYASAEIHVSLDHHAKERYVCIEAERGMMEYRPLASPVLRIHRSLPQSREARLEDECLDFDEGHNIALALQYFARVLEAEVPDNADAAVEITSQIAQWGKDAARGQT